MPPEAKLGSTLIWYKASSPENMDYWFKSVDTFLEGDFGRFFFCYMTAA